MTQIAVVNLSTSVDPRDLAYFCKAWDMQAAAFALDWSVPYTPVVLYDHPDGLPTDTGECRLFTIQDDIGAPGAEGFHDDVLGDIYARILPDGNCEAGSHEVVEEEGDADCNGWTLMPDGREVAKESADPVEGDHYIISVSIGGTSRDVPVTNYVTPDWFDAKAKGPFDRMGKLTAPFTMDDGGYMIVRAADGSVSNIFAARPYIVPGPKMNAQHVFAKLQKPESRLARRLGARR